MGGEKNVIRSQILRITLITCSRKTIKQMIFSKINPIFAFAQRHIFLGCLKMFLVEIYLNVRNSFVE